MIDGTLGMGALPQIRRARGYRLYSENGKRFLDLCQDGGRGVLGAKGTGIGTTAKGAIDMGLASPLPSIYERRLSKAILALWPEYRATRFYSTPGEAALALAAASGLTSLPCLTQGGIEKVLLLDPARREGAIGKPLALELRPFGEFLGKPEAPPEAAWLLFPCPRALAPTALLFRTEEAVSAFAAEAVPPLLLASGLKALAEYKGFRARTGEETWRKADRRLSGLFERKGPWLYPLCPRESYGRLFSEALERGVFLSPEWEMPSILPADFDDGELKPLATIEH